MRTAWRERCKMSAWSGFGDYVEKLGAPMTGQGDAANFEQMLEKALAAEAAARVLPHGLHTRAPIDGAYTPVDLQTDLQLQQAG